MANSTTNAAIFHLLEQWAPKKMAYDWDNVGLQVGSYTKPVKKIMVTLDVLESVVDEAIEKEVDLIIAHHPLLFKPLKQLNLDHWRGRVIQKLIRHDITVYAAHTNLDVAEGGVNDILSDLLNLTDRDVLDKTMEDSLYKLAVYVPETHLDTVLTALSEAGAGHIGSYSHCTFQTKGTGTFMPEIGANPFIGERSKLEKVSEIKVETLVQESILAKVLQAMLKAHPYEEVAYDLFQLKNEGEILGVGRVGSLRDAMKLEDFVTYTKKALEIDHVRVSGDLSRMVKRVAVLGGSGEKYINAALQKKADVYITGDMTFHFAQEAIEMGISVIDAGHYIEKVMKKRTKQYLEEKIRDGSVTDTSIEVIESEVNTDPFLYR